MTTTPTERIEIIREELGLNYSELGSLAGASKSVVNQWKTGNIKSISARYAYAIEEKTKFIAKWIMLDIGPARKTDSLTSTSLISKKRLPEDELQDEVVNYLSNIDAEDVDVWLVTIKALSNKARKKKHEQEKSDRQPISGATDPPPEYRRTA